MSHPCPIGAPWRGGKEKPGGSDQERRAHIFNMDISSKSRSTGQWVLMGFFTFLKLAHFLPLQPSAQNLN
jgi:hypothetical protein